MARLSRRSCSIWFPIAGAVLLGACHWLVSEPNHDDETRSVYAWMISNLHEDGPLLISPSSRMLSQMIVVRTYGQRFSGRCMRFRTPQREPSELPKKTAGGQTARGSGSNHRGEVAGRLGSERVTDSAPEISGRDKPTSVFENQLQRSAHVGCDSRGSLVRRHVR
jgi:hypothetical protein